VYSVAWDGEKPRTTMHSVREIKKPNRQIEDNLALFIALVIILFRIF
jgi:hypothetical protein